MDTGFYDSCEQRTCDMRWCDLLDKRPSHLTFTDRIALHLFMYRATTPNLTSKVGDTYSESDINYDIWLDIIEHEFESWVNDNTTSICKLQQKLDNRITRALLWVAMSM